MVQLEEKVETALFDGDDNDDFAGIPLDERRIAWEPQSPSAYDLHRRRNRGNLQLQPNFQRRLVWNEQKKSRFIESILLEVPLPLIYLAEDFEGKQVVVDGQQRLDAVFSFIDGDISLTDLRVMEELNGKQFRELSDKLQNKIEDRSFSLILIKNDSNEDMKYDVFERLNTGSSQLNAQELRNCVNRGRFNDFIIELSENQLFQNLCKFTDTQKSRMLDVEHVLRFFAFYDLSFQNYKKGMKRFLDAEMKNRKNVQSQEIQRLRQAFVGAVNLSNSVFGDRSFRRYDSRESGGQWGRTVNVAIKDVILYGFATRLHDRAKITTKSDSIREALLDLLVNDEKFISSIDQHTSDEDKVRYRFEKWLAELDEIIAGSEEQGPRFFSLKLKEDLYNADPTCKICGQRLHSIDDSEVDHVEPYWKGGRTIPENARLTHRYCNRARKRGESAS